MTALGPSVVVPYALLHIPAALGPVGPWSTTPSRALPCVAAGTEPVSRVVEPKPVQAIDEEAALATLLAAIRSTALHVGTAPVVSKAPVRELQAMPRDVTEVGGRVLRRPYEASANAGLPIHQEEKAEAKGEACTAKPDCFPWPPQKIRKEPSEVCNSILFMV